MQPRILVADDDQGVIASYRAVLVDMKPPADDPVGSLAEDLFGPWEAMPAGGLPWRVDFVHQGQDAFNAVCAAVMQSDPYALVFLDIRMPPGIDGCEAARRIRHIDKDVRIVFVTGYSDYTEEELIEAAGPAEYVDFMQKPFWPEHLRSTALAYCQAA